MKKVDEGDEKGKDLSNRFVNAFDIWSLGITIVIGGQYFGWNVGLSAGFGTMAIATCLMGSAYVIFIISISEITSALPFAGGAYGLARCSLGFYPGFMIGCCEAIEYIFYVSASALSLGSMICTVFNLSLSYQPMIWFLFYVSALAIQIPGGRVFWYSVKCFAIVSILVIVIYCLGCFQYINYEKYTPYYLDDDSTGVHSISNYGNFVGGMAGFMRVFPLAAWFYVGVESLPFANDKVIDTRRNMPIGLITCAVTLFISSLFVYFVVCGLPPGTEQTSVLLAVFNSGFGKMFKISNNQALLLSIPATYATAFGFIYPYGRLIEALANSKLLPQVLSVKTLFHNTVVPINEDNKRNSASSSKSQSNAAVGNGSNTVRVNKASSVVKVTRRESTNSVSSQLSDGSTHRYQKESTPFVAMIAGSTLGYFICLLQYYWVYLSFHLFSICILSAFVIYIAQCIGYIVLKLKFQSIKREFYSPFGIPGVIYSGIVFSFGVLSIIGFQGDNQFAIYVFLIMTGLITIYYFTVAKFTQTFSSDEQKVMFVAHVITYNNRNTKLRVRSLGNRSSMSRAPSAFVSNQSKVVLKTPKRNSQIQVFPIDNNLEDIDEVDETALDGSPPKPLKSEKVQSVKKSNILEDIIEIDDTELDSSLVKHQSSTKQSSSKSNKLLGI